MRVTAEIVVDEKAIQTACDMLTALAPFEKTVPRPLLEAVMMAIVGHLHFEAVFENNKDDDDE